MMGVWCERDLKQRTSACESNAAPRIYTSSVTLYLKHVRDTGVYNICPFMTSTPLVSPRAYVSCRGVRAPGARQSWPLAGISGAHPGGFGRSKAM
jgi:hypothetical protein